MQSPKIVITGGLGFIFSYVTQYFVEKGWRVVVIDNLSAGSNPQIIDGSFVHHNVHMANPDVVGLIIREKPDYLVHAAAITDVDYSVLEPHRTMTKNTLGMLHTFEAARRLPELKKFMYVATDEIYGECDRPMKEDDIILPKNPYSCSKAVGSLVRVAYDNTYPVLKGKTVETRMCNIFGSRQDTRKIMPQLKKSIAGNHSIPLHEGGVGYREYLYVKNIPPAIELILEKGTGVYNMSLGDGYTVNELIEKTEKITGKKVKTHKGDRPGMDRKYQTDAERLKTLGWKPLYTFEEGLKEYFSETKEVSVDPTPSERGKKKIVIGTNDLLMGGVQRLVIDQLNAIDRRAFDIHLIVLMEFPGKGTFDDLIPSDVTVHRLKFSGLLDVVKWVKLLLLLRTLRPAVVKTATFFSNTVFLLLQPFVGYAVIVAEHNTLILKAFWQRSLDRILYPNAYTVIADSKSVVEYISEKERIAEKHFTVVYNGVDLEAIATSKQSYLPERTKIRAEYEIPANAYVFFTAGRLIGQKNHHLMIEGFAKLHEKNTNAYLIIAGGGKHEQALKDLAVERGVEKNVHILGEQKNVHRLYAIADAFLLTSRHEGFCIAAMEGLAFGLPLVSTNVAGVREYLDDGKNGFFVEPTPEDIAQKLEKVIALSPSERTRFERTAEETASRYSTVRYGEVFNELVMRAIDAKDYDIR